LQIVEREDFRHKIPMAISEPYITILGSGTSQGVPMIGCPCPVCHSSDPRDHRTRSSIYVHTEEVAILVDTTPELRTQALRENLTRVEAVLMTHSHADHLMGFDDLRRFCDLKKGEMPIYGSAPTLAFMQQVFHYAFDLNLKIPAYVRAIPHPVTSTFTVGAWSITPYPVPHGRTETFGYAFAREGRWRFAYFSDCKSIPAETVAALRDVPLLIIDGLRVEPHPTHLTQAEAIALGREMRAQRIYLTHLTHQRLHAELEPELPEGVKLAYDGLTLLV
jgi:phosphoribosyl 1,2-cyclic phosphate phosphodiesterase